MAGRAELVTLQQLPDIALIEFTARIVDDLRDAYASVRAKDRRWTTPFEDIELLINPNGVLLNGGSDGDNGQTGRKLVVDYYGPRVAQLGFSVAIRTTSRRISASTPGRPGRRRT